MEIEKSSYKGAYCVIYALKKFTGGLGDDDDRVICDGHTWQRYFLKVRGVGKMIKMYF